MRFHPVAGFLTVGLMTVVSFTNALGSVIMFPLGPFLAADLGVPAQDAAFTSAAYAAAAGVGGLLSALFLGRIERRVALVGSLGVVGLGTLAAGLAPEFRSLLAARMVSGLCAGPLLAAVIATVAQAVPESGRNRAVSAIIGSYGLALVLGLPLALTMTATSAGWRGPLLVLAGVCLALLLPIWFTLRPFEREPDPIAPIGLLRLIQRPESLTGLLLIAGASFATLLISPHIGTFALRNAGISDAGLRTVFVVGGGLALLTTGLTGWAMDRVGPLAASIGVSVVLTILLSFSFIVPVAPGLAIPVLGMLLAGQLARSAVAQASATRVARPGDQMTYQCLVAATTSLAQAAGAGVSTVILQEMPSGRLRGMASVALISIGLAWLAPMLLLVLKAQLARRDHTATTGD